MHQPLSPTEVARDLAVRDLTDPSAGPHALQQLVGTAVGALASSWPCAVREVRGPRVVPVADNYDALGFDPQGVTRDARYTRYVDARSMLRSHASAMVPPALRELAALVEGPLDVLLVCPGITYRRDAIDRLHSGTPHQLDLWRVGTAEVGEADLPVMVERLLAALLPGRPWRSQPRVHPYTCAGRQVDVEVDGTWVEVLECGLAHPDVLAAAGLTGVSGLALGMGLDRVLMVRKGIPDIRLLRSADPRVASQMLDLAPYRPVSSMPAVMRDMSVAVDVDDAVEDLGDRVRHALGSEADVVESVTVLSRTAYGDLPPAARLRLGLTPAHANLLVRVVLRPLDRTLTAGEANDLRDRIFAAVHRGAPPDQRRPVARTATTSATSD